MTYYIACLYYIAKKKIVQIVYKLALMALGSKISIKNVLSPILKAILTIVTRGILPGFSRFNS